MPPQRTIIVDHNQFILSISALADAQRETLLLDQANRDPDRIVWGTEVAHDEDIVDGWVPRNLNAIAGYPLSASERKRWQEAVRELEAAGLVETCTVQIRLTEVGNKLANELKNQTPAPAATTT